MVMRQTARLRARRYGRCVALLLLLSGNTALLFAQEAQSPYYVTPPETESEPAEDDESAPAETAVEEAEPEVAAEPEPPLGDRLGDQVCGGRLGHAAGGERGNGGGGPRPLRPRHGRPGLEAPLRGPDRMLLSDGLKDLDAEWKMASRTDKGLVTGGKHPLGGDSRNALKRSQTSDT